MRTSESIEKKTEFESHLAELQTQIEPAMHQADRLAKSWHCVKASWRRMQKKSIG